VKLQIPCDPFARDAPFFHPWDGVAVGMSRGTLAGRMRWGGALACGCGRTRGRIVPDPLSIAGTEGTEDGPGYCCMISTTRLTIAVIASSFRCPAVYWMILLSAVKIRVGRTLLSCRSEPDEKSPSLMRIAYRSDTSRLVIWQRITSSPSGVARAGRF